MNRSVPHVYLMFVVVACLVCLIPPGFAHATTVSATATGDVLSAESTLADRPQVGLQQEPSGQGLASQNAAATEHNNWTFDLTQDPNFAMFVRESRPVKSALLTLTVAPERFQISPDTLGLQPLADDNQHKALNFSIQIEVDLLELYEPDELLDLLASNAGKLQIPYPDPDAISAAQIHLTTETPEPVFSRSMLILTGVLTVILVGFSVVWRNRRRPAGADVDMNNPQAVGISEADARMALVGNMASSIVHDVKNAFTAIRSCAEVIGDDGLNAADRKDFAQLIVNEIDRGVDMTQELLDFTSGKHRALNLQSADIAKLLDEMIPVVRQDLQSRHIVLSTEFQETGSLPVDAQKLKRVFLNIISNARDAMPDGGSLRIVSSVDNEWICIDFSDTGSGIAPELQAHMFEPMVTHGKTHGTGLGLAIVKDILDAHHSKITVYSEVGKGTTIRILLRKE